VQDKHAFLKDEQQVFGPSRNLHERLTGQRGRQIYGPAQSRFPHIDIRQAVADDQWVHAAAGGFDFRQLRHCPTHCSKYSLYSRYPNFGHKKARPGRAS
jgi:hypothetical protein